MSSYSLRVKLNQYYSLKNNVSTTVRYVREAYNKAADCNSLGSAFSINDSKADNNLIGSNMEKLEQTMNTLENSVIPWIEEKIRQLNYQIRVAEAEEAAAGN